MTVTKKEQLEWAIRSWRESADSEDSLADFLDKQGKYGNTDSYRVCADSCRRTANALEKELETGKPHCNCHLLPFDNCPFKKDA